MATSISSSYMSQLVTWRNQDTTLESTPKLIAAEVGFALLTLVSTVEALARTIFKFLSSYLYPTAFTKGSAVEVEAGERRDSSVATITWGIKNLFANFNQAPLENVEPPSGNTPPRASALSR